MSAAGPLDQRRRSRRFAVFAIVLGVVAGGLLGPAGAGMQARFVLGLGADPLAMTLPVLPVVTVLALAVIAIGAYQYVRGFGGRDTSALAVVSLLSLAALLTWAARGDDLNLVGFLQGSVRAAVPLTLGALAGLLCERAGVINIAIEAQFLTGAFVAAVAASIAGSAWAGLGGGLLAGALVGGLLAILSIRYRADQIVVGVVLIVLASGLTSFLTTQLLADDASLNSPPGLPRIEIPLLHEIPFLGPVLFRQSVTVYLMILVVVLVEILLFRTRWGLRVRAVGEHPRAADTVGIAVLRTRYQAVILGGLVAGIAGAYFTLDAAAQFSRDMTGGRGFIALAAMLVGRYHPRGALAAAFIFGIADALATSLAILSVGIPSNLLLTTPYLVTIVVVAGVVGRIRVPAADGQPYVTE